MAKKKLKKQPKSKENQNRSLMSTARIHVSLCTTVVHNTTQNSSNNVPSYRPDNHHYSDIVYWMAGGRLTQSNSKKSQLNKLDIVLGVNCTN